MAKNNSEFTVHLHTEAGELVSVEPGDDIPSSLAGRIDNPYVTGKKKEEEPEGEVQTPDPEVKPSSSSRRKS